MTNILRRRKRAREHPLGRAKTLIFRCEPTRPVILDGSHYGLPGARIRLKQNSLPLRIAWNNTLWTMALGGSGGGPRHLALPPPPRPTPLRKPTPPETPP